MKRKFGKSNRSNFDFLLTNWAFDNQFGTKYCASVMKKIVKYCIYCAKC